ncbi:MAG: sugar transferase, partial [Lachnospiraceae bacterium]|nr:sugar transferase [Lachnospiraceae bacterium]
MKVVYKFVKRAFDFTMSLLAILVTGPLWGIFALAIKLSSKGPVFFTTDRIGKDRKPFTL